MTNQSILLLRSFRSVGVLRFLKIGESKVEELLRPSCVRCSASASFDEVVFPLLQPLQDKSDFLFTAGLMIGSSVPWWNPFSPDFSEWGPSMTIALISSVSKWVPISPFSIKSCWSVMVYLEASQQHNRGSAKRRRRRRQKRHRPEGWEYVYCYLREAQSRCGSTTRKHYGHSYWKNCSSITSCSKDHSFPGISEHSSSLRPDSPLFMHGPDGLWRVLLRVLPRNL